MSEHARYHVIGRAIGEHARGRGVSQGMGAMMLPVGVDAGPPQRPGDDPVKAVRRPLEACERGPGVQEDVGVVALRALVADVVRYRCRHLVGEREHEGVARLRLQDGHGTRGHVHVREPQPPDVAHPHPGNRRQQHDGPIPLGTLAFDGGQSGRDLGSVVARGKGRTLVPGYHAQRGRHRLVYFAPCGEEPEEGAKRVQHLRLGLGAATPVTRLHVRRHVLDPYVGDSLRADAGQEEPDAARLPAYGRLPESPRPHLRQP